MNQPIDERTARGLDERSGRGERFANERKLQQMRRGPSIIAAAMIVGVLLFGGIVVFTTQMGPARTREPVELPIPSAVAAVAASLVSLACVAISFFLRRRRLEASAASAEPIVRGQAFAGASIVSLALCEGPALLAAALAMVTRDLADFAPAYALALGGVLVQFPTPAAFDRYVAEPASHG